MSKPIIGIACGDDGCRHFEMSELELQTILREASEAKQKRAEDMPTDEDAVRALHRAWLRLKELGWREAMYAPRDGSYFDSIEAGSTGIHNTRVMMLAHEHPTFWVDADGDSWPARPVLFRIRAATKEGDYER